MTSDISVESDTSTPAIDSSISRGYLIRAWMIMLVCLVLGIWGIYDYVWAIPQQAEFFQRRDMSQRVKEVLEKANDPQLNLEARDTLISEIDEQMPPDADQLLTFDVLNNETAKADGEVSWIVALIAYRRGLQSAPLPSGLPSNEMRAAGVLAERNLSLYEDAQEPSVYDRPVQWLFILSLLFVPYYAWVLLNFTPRKYWIDENGTLHMPEGTWKQDEISDIDMSRWMAKSTAWVVHVDGSRVKLDAYIYKNLHLIIGNIAHGLYPESWEIDARRIKPVEGTPVDDGQDS